MRVSGETQEIILAGTATIVATSGGEMRPTLTRGWGLPEEACRTADYSLGAEHMSFHTTKPILITAFDSPGGGFNPEFFVGRRLSIPTAATVERSFTPQITPPSDPECGETAAPTSGSRRDGCGWTCGDLPPISGGGLSRFQQLLATAS